jgi:hypothetical protein
MELGLIFVPESPPSCHNVFHKQRYVCYLLGTICLFSLREKDNVMIQIQLTGGLSVPFVPTKIHVP